VIYRIRFDSLDWICPRPGARFKRLIEGDTQVRLVEFRPELSHPEWCTVGHAGCVLEGVLELEFADQTLRFEAGDGLLIPSGEAHRHIPRALSERVLLLLVEAAPAP
jgi:quercetin dioxygenase-like cupin family protein